MNKTPYFKFAISYTELSLAIRLCYAIVNNIAEEWLKSDYFIGSVHIKDLAIYLNEELRANEDKEGFTISLTEHHALNLDTVLSRLLDLGTSRFTEEQNDILDGLFERYSDMWSEFFHEQIKKKQE